MKKIIITIYLVLSSALVFSQYIEGKVLDAETNKPIEGVNVFMEGINRGAITNEKGNFYLKFPYEIVKSGVIKFSHVTYKAVEILYTPEKKEYSVYLQIDVTKLREINVLSNIDLKPSIKYKSLANIKTAVYSFGSLLKDEKIYVVGGNASYEENVFKKLMEYDPERALAKMMNGTARNFNKESYNGNLQIYDLKNDIWEKSDVEFRKRAAHNIHLTDNQLYIIGGKSLSRSKKREYLDDKIEIFDFETNSIKVDNTNPHQAVDFASFVYQNNLIVMGGSIKQNSIGIKQYNNKVHLFNPKTGLWYQIGNMPIAKETQGVLVNDKFYLIGGNNGRPLSAIESYNLITGKWKKEGNLFYGISKPAITSNKNSIYIFDNGKLITFNTLTGELTAYLIDLYVSNSEMIFSKNKLYIFGGTKVNRHSSFPSRGVYGINIEELNNTKIHQSKTLK